MSRRECPSLNPCTAIQAGMAGRPAAMPGLPPGRPGGAAPSEAAFRRRHEACRDGQAA